MEWYNYIGLIIIISTLIGEILRAYGYIFPDMSFEYGALILGALIALGIILLFIDLE